MISLNGAALKAEALQAAEWAFCCLKIRLAASKCKPIRIRKDNFKGFCWNLV
jgi:hypothetical protein